ncbi:monovalent cation/H+ antiporter complex subunit F [Spongiibacter marinus]|uniref:monovalent cation/H+ antiporter complex subunit F n=1 Tax=Spongiibacter marinus TaxID=354246 RepID=UPI00356157D6
MLTVTTVTLLLVMALALSRAFVGPTVFDRILAANMFGTKTVLLIAVIGFLFGRPEFLDIAMVYALINFIGVIGMLRLIEYLEDENRSNQEEDA